jgi:uncharacterized protein YqjF (DUF2071 family)
MSLNHLRFTPTQLSKPAPGPLAAETTLLHFVIVTYLVDASVLRTHLHPRFEPDCIDCDGDAPQALVSVVTFLDRDFRFVVCPWLKNSFGQTNYRSYVTDTVTGDHVAWFFGTCLDSRSVAVPRYAWRLPWHRAQMAFDCRYDERVGRYVSFNVETRSRWAPAQLEIEDSGEPPRELAGFSNLEAGLVLLTQPTRGFFFRQDGALGSYSIWHDRLRPTVGKIKRARYWLLQQLNLIQEGDCRNVHSVLIQRSVDFTIYLPPVRISGEAG